MRASYQPTDDLTDRFASDEVSETCVKVDTLGLDAFECGALAVARHFLVGLEKPETHAWRHAYDIAVQRWGEAIGFPAAHGLANILRPVLRRRSDGFAFQDPLCAEARLKATKDEMALLRMIHFMRRGETPAARRCVEALLRGRRDADVIQAGLSFAARFPAGVEAPVIAPERPRLCLVQ